MRRFSLLFFIAFIGAALAQEPAVADARSNAGSLRRNADVERASAATVTEEPSQHRQLIGFWSLLFLLNPNECPPFGKPHEDCMKKRAEADAANAANSDSSSSYSTDASSSSSSSSEESRAFSWLMLVAAAAAFALAIAAVVVGQRKEDSENHPLKGSIGRRMGLFSNFAKSSLFKNKIDRPQRVVEMTLSGGEGDAGKYSGLV